MPDYDVVIAGGSVSGLLAAREIAGGGLLLQFLRKMQKLELLSTAVGL